MEKIEKPWGEKIILFSSKEKKVSLTTINPKQRTSLHLHNLKDEKNYILNGTAVYEIDDKIDIFCEEDIINIIKNNLHRIYNPDKDNSLIILEIQKGNLEKEDTLKLEDDYGRI